LLKKGKVHIRSKESVPNTIVSIGVREGKLYRLEGMLICRSKGMLYIFHSYVNGPMSMEEDEDQDDSKGEQSSWSSSSRSQPLGGKEDFFPSSYVKRPSWYELTLMDS
jgi:hypothetical protein